jgi:polyisoprenoid-binding protein YceI
MTRPGGSQGRPRAGWSFRGAATAPATEVAAPQRGASEAGVHLGRRGLAHLLAGLVLGLAWGASAADAPTWQLAEGEVRVTCPLTVGGSFEAKTSSLAGTLVLAASRPPSFSGEIAVDLRTLDTGIDLRNSHLKEGYLEVTKADGFDKALLTDLRLDNVDVATFQGHTGFSGTFLVHGIKKPVTGQVEVHREGSNIRVEASFPVVLSDHGIALPQYLGVGVKNQVQVKVKLVARPLDPAAGASR